MTPRKTIASMTVGTAVLFGGIDAAVMNEEPLERVAEIKNERVEVRQVENVVEANLPWKGQPGLTIKADMGEPTIPERVADKRKKEVVVEVLNDSMKIDFILNEKPETNRFCQVIEGAEDYDFFYQPPLTEEEIAEGAERPENVVGSYAVYHKTLKNHKLGGTNYETGKAWHIYRPEVWEVNSTSTRTWAELSFADSELCVTVPQDFLDSAVYPVRVDPTFGYETIGGSQRGLNPDANEIALIVSNNATGIFDVPEDGTITTISFYGENAGTVRPVVYDDDNAGALVTYGAEASISAAAWNDLAVTNAAITGGNTLSFGIWSNTNDIGYHYDEDADYFTEVPGVTYHSTNPPPDPRPTGLDEVGNKMSIYATYSVPAEETPTPSVFWFD